MSKKTAVFPAGNEAGSVTNYATVTGQVTGIEKKLIYSKAKGKANIWYRVSLKVLRLSGNTDEVPVMVPSRLFLENSIEEGRYMIADGRILSNNYHDGDGKKHLDVHISADAVAVLEDEGDLGYISDKNLVSFEGVIVKKPVFRITSLGRRIASLFVAINTPVKGRGGRTRTCSSYIPVIAWGPAAKEAAGLGEGTVIEAAGRFQSRTYCSRGSVTDRKTYEVSLFSFTVKTAHEESARPVIRKEMLKVAGNGKAGGKKIA